MLRARRIQQQLSSVEDPHANQRGIDGGLAECILVTLEDMTALKEAMDTHRLIFDQALEPLVMTDEQGVVEFFNQVSKLPPYSVALWTALGE
jgi:PAS domain-containing protein